MQQKAADQAINAAIKQDWSRAIKINLEILENEPDHIPTLNRLAKAYKEAGQHENSLKTYKKVTELDPYNGIAQKNLKKLINNQSYNSGCHDKLITNFVQEPGKTKCISLSRLAETKIIEALQPGQPVKLVPKNFMINILTNQDIRIGAITDEYSFILKKCLEEGNQYQAAIHTINQSKVAIFIRETHRADNRRHNPTFTNQ